MRTKPYFRHSSTSPGILAILPNTCTARSAFTCAPVCLFTHLPSRCSVLAASHSPASAGHRHRLSPQPMNTGSAPA